MSARKPHKVGDFVRNARWRDNRSDRKVYRVLSVEKKRTDWRGKNRKYNFTYYEYTLELLIDHNGRLLKHPKRWGRWNRPIKSTDWLRKCELKPFPEK